MKNTFDTDSYLFGILKGSETLKTAMTGKVYAGQRSLNSIKEDVTINTIALTQEFLPQLGTSNINVHVADMSVTLDGVKQKMANRDRLNMLSKIVLGAIRESKIAGVGFTIENQTVMQEAEVSQHYVNIRINWFIH